ncbi:MAG: hypothetical protein Aureis2KO_05960 [Aureisphaera sp.]
MILLSCQKKDTSWSAERVISIHKQIDSLPQDSVYSLLKRAEKEIKNNPERFDTLSIKNDYWLGKHFGIRGALDSSAYYYQRTVDQVKGPITYKKAYNYFFNAHEAYLNLGKYGDCIAIGEKLIDRLDSTAFKERALAYVILSDAHTKLGNLEIANGHNKKQIELLKKSGDKKGLYGTLIFYAQKLYYKGDKEESFHLLDSLLGHLDEIPEVSQYQLYGNYGVYEFYEGNFTKSRDNYQKGLEIKKRLPEEFDKIPLLATSYANLAEVCIELNELNSARRYLDTLAQLGIHNIPRRIRKSALRYELKWANATNSNLSTLYNHLDTIAKYQELSYNDKIQNELVELTKANEKEKQILREKLETEVANANLKTSLLFVGVLVSLLFSFGLLFYFRRKLKFERNSLQLQQRLLRSQMNPHFTFNTLHAIQNQIKKEPEKATNYLLKFSRLLRLFLENSMGDYVPLEKEIDSLKKYMDLQQLRSPQQFEYHFHFNNMEEDEFLFIPPMLLQPFIENSIQHGFIGIDHKGRIDIRLDLQGKFIHCTIEDNGIGLTAKNNMEKQSASTQLISDFLKKLTRTELQIIDKSETDSQASGTLVRFSIPFTLTEEG